jgi:hypothetical protein
VAAGTLGSQASDGLDYVDVPFTITAGTFKLDADITFPQVIDGLYSDLDVYLLDSADNVVTKSENSGGPEHISTTDISAGNYRYRVSGFLAQNTSFEITSRQFKGTGVPAPTLGPITGDFANAQGEQLDFDGTVNLSWTAHDGEQGFEIERSSDDKDAAGNPIPDDQKTWAILADVGSNVTSYSAAGQSNGKHFFRVRAIFPGQIGMFVTDPSNVVNVVVSTRSKVDITSVIRYPIASMSIANGVGQVDINLLNDSTQTYLPYVEFNVIGVNSASGTVKVTNADNQKDGKSPANAALFGFSDKLGADGVFGPGEVTPGTRRILLADSLSEGFYFDVLVTGYVGTGGSSGSGSSSSSSNGSQTSSSDPTAILPLNQTKTVMRFTVNPLTKTVTTKLVSLK